MWIQSASRVLTLPLMLALVITFGYSSGETEGVTPPTHSMTTRLGKKLTDALEKRDPRWLRPDGKHVTIEYAHKSKRRSVKFAIDPTRAHSAAHRGAD